MIIPKISTIVRLSPASDLLHCCTYGKTALAVAFAAADQAPRVTVNDRKILLPARSEWVIKIVAESCWLLPSIHRVSEKHAQKMASASSTIATSVCLASVHDA